MNILVLTGSANPRLAAAVAERLGVALGRVTLERFPDSELHVRVEDSVRAQDVYIVQPTSPPVEQHLMELLFLADACRRAGAGRLTAVMPYFGYARQDRRASGREAIGARLVADLVRAAGIARVVAVDLHTPALEGFFPVPLEHLSAVPLLTEALRAWAGVNAVIVSPDLGAVKLAEHYASALKLPVAIVHKARLTGEEVRVERIVGRVEGRWPVLVDDMVSTGGTIEAAARALVAAGSAAEFIVVASHALLVGRAIQRLSGLSIRPMLATDSVPQPADMPFPVKTISLAPLLADAIKRLHRGESLAGLIKHQ